MNCYTAEHSVLHDVSRSCFTPHSFPFFLAPLLRTAALLGLPLLLPLVMPAQQAGGVAPSSSPIRLVRAVIGAKGEARNGTFVMTEPRSVFYAPDDKEIIVYFEWEGFKGVHHCEGSVHGPNGEFASMSSFDYVATQPRFAGFWKVPLSASTPPGGWTFESKVDGQAAGQVSFQVVVAARPPGTGADSTVPVAPPLPTPADIYARAIAASVDVEALDSHEHTIRRTSGFLIKDTAVVTSFRSIDGASTLRLRLSNGTLLPTSVLVASDRQQDWAILGLNPSATHLLLLAETKSWKVGDQCYWLDVKSDGSRILSDGQIVGMKSPQHWGDRIDFSGLYSSSAMGGALLNDRAEVIGILGGTLPETYLNSFVAQVQSDSDFPSFISGGIAVAANLLPQPFPPSPVSLQDLWSKGLMTPPLAASQYVLFGMLTQGGKVADKKAPPVERDNKVRFRRGDNSANALIHFANSTSFKTTAALKLYDLDNHLLASANPEKVNVNRGNHAERVWQLPLTNLPVGIYRVDLEMPEGVAWRQYFQLTD